MPAKSQFSELDFFTIKEELKNFLKGQDRFLDYDFEGSNMSVLLDLLAQNTFQNNFYTNMAYNEMFLDTAQLRNSLISHAKELNYLPRSRRAARAQLLIELTNVDQVYDRRPPFIMIPAYTEIVGQKNGNRFIFSSDEDYAITPDSTGAYCRSDIFVYEGSVKTENFVVTGDPNQRFVISNVNVDTNSIRVKVRINTDITSSKTTYKFKENLFGVLQDERVFYIQPALDNKYEIVFGKDIFGKQPTVNSVIEVTYRVTNGDAANGINQFKIDGIEFGNVTTAANIITVAAAEGGTEQEDNESIRFFAPKSLAAQERAVTESDYVTLLKNRFPEIQTVAVYGGEEADPPQFGRVIVAVDVNNAQGASERSKVEFANYLKERSPLSIEPRVVSAQFMNLYLETTVYYNMAKSNLSTSNVRESVINTITDYSNTYLNEFGKTFRYSKLVGAIDDGDENIVSNQTNVKAIIEIEPDTTARNYTVNFKNQLEYDYLNSSNLSIYKPAITSSTFNYNGNVAYMQDDGNGNIQILKYSTASASFVYLNRSAGTIDYTNGKVILSGFFVDESIGSIVKIYANVKAKDIITPKERILSIRAEDINLKVLGIKA